MDLQEERGAFERSPKVARRLSYLHPTIVWFGEDNLYHSSFEGFQDMVHWLNGGWEAWQAAKAQAVPEGFVLVPMVPSERMVNAVRQCYEGESYLPYSLYSEFVNQAIIERMETQEPTND